MKKAAIVSKVETSYEDQPSLVAKNYVLVMIIDEDLYTTLRKWRKLVLSTQGARAMLMSLDADTPIGFIQPANPAITHDALAEELQTVLDGDGALIFHEPKVVKQLDELRFMFKVDKRLFGVVMKPNSLIIHVGECGDSVELPWFQIEALGLDKPEGTPGPVPPTSEGMR